MEKLIFLKLSKLRRRCFSWNLAHEWLKRIQHH